MNLRQKYKRLKKENEELKKLSATSRPVICNVRSSMISKICAETSFDRYEYSRMIDNDLFDAKDMIRRELMYTMTDGLLEHMSINGHVDNLSDRVIFRGELKVVDKGGSSCE